MHSHGAHQSRGTQYAVTGHSRAVLGALLLVAVAVVIGIIWTWPSHHHRSNSTARTVSGTVTSSTEQGCQASPTACSIEVRVAITSGPDAGASTTLTFATGPTNPQLSPGEHILLGRLAQNGQVSYQFGDIARGRSLLLLAVLFAVVVLVVGRLRGLAALIGLGFSGVLLVLFVLPALLDGQSPARVSLLAGAAITLVVLPLAHGLSLRTAIAAIATLSAVALAAGLSAVSVHALHITGLSGEENATLQLLGSHASVGGLLFAGIVIGALGVLNDVTVTQVSAVSELLASGLDKRQSFTAGMRIGRDHIASTVYSLALAYAGSALPLLLLFSLSGQSVLDVLTSDSLAPEIAAALIGGTALAAVVPLTTGLAAALLSRDEAASGTDQDLAAPVNRRGWPARNRPRLQQ